MRPYAVPEARLYVAGPGEMDSSVRQAIRYNKNETPNHSYIPLERTTLTEPFNSWIWDQEAIQPGSLVLVYHNLDYELLIGDCSLALPANTAKLVTLLAEYVDLLYNFLNPNLTTAKTMVVCWPIGSHMSYFPKNCTHHLPFQRENCASYNNPALLLGKRITHATNLLVLETQNRHSKAVALDQPTGLVVRGILDLEPPTHMSDEVIARANKVMSTVYLEQHSDAHYLNVEAANHYLHGKGKWLCHASQRRLFKACRKMVTYYPPPPPTPVQGCSYETKEEAPLKESNQYDPSDPYLPASTQPEKGEQDKKPLSTVASPTRSVTPIPHSNNVPEVIVIDGEEPPAFSQTALLSPIPSIRGSPRSYTSSSSSSDSSSSSSDTPEDEKPKGKRTHSEAVQEPKPPIKREKMSPLKATIEVRMPTEVSICPSVEGIFCRIPKEITFHLVINNSIIFKEELFFSTWNYSYV